MAGQVNEDMSLVANGHGSEVVDYYGLVNISDASKVGTQGSEDEKQVRTDALVNNVWAAAVLVGQIQDAEKKLIKLIGMHPHLYSLHYTLAMAYSAQGRLQESKRQLRRCSAPLSDKQASKMSKSDAVFMLPHCRAGYALSPSLSLLDSLATTLGVAHAVFRHLGSTYHLHLTTIINCILFHSSILSCFIVGVLHCMMQASDSAHKARSL
jgi:hypothetical protein